MRREVGIDREEWRKEGQRSEAGCEKIGAEGRRVDGGWDGGRREKEEREEKKERRREKVEEGEGRMERRGEKWKKREGEESDGWRMVDEGKGLRGGRRGRG